MGHLTHLWLDFETTDLDPVNCSILEVAVIGTTPDPTEELFVFETLVRGKPGWLDRIATNPVVQTMHRESGLSDAIASAVDVPSLEQVDELLAGIVRQHRGDEPVKLSGTGVGHFDHLVITAQMPQLEAELFYGNADIGDMRRFFFDTTGLDLVPKAPVEHRALADVREGIRQALEVRRIFRAEAARRADGEAAR